MACKYIYEGIAYNSKEDFVNQVLILKEGKKFLSKTDINSSNFLNLLSKDNNWVTFFIKSIIADSAKKGYEKVLFPTGNTASKVEGHTTLEEFKEEKEGRLKWLNDYLEMANESIQNPESKYHKESQGYIAGFNGISHGDKEAFVEIVKSEKIKINNEINQLKQELERVETEGFGALKPIYNFYENVVTNILKKQGYNPVLITDEYGNTWNEVVINDTSKSTILLQQSNKKNELSDKELEVKINNFLSKIGVNVKSVENIKDSQGKVLSAVAKADMLNKIIEIVEGNADISTLPEEAAHFFVEMLDKNGPLYKEMFDKITSFDLYSDVLNEYKNTYRNSDGTINFKKIKEEAIGKLIAKHIVEKSLQERKNSNLNFLNNWWNKLWKFVTSVFKKSNDNPFKTSADMILSGNTDALTNMELSDSNFYQLSNTKNNLEKLLQHQTELILDNSVDPISKQKRHIYKFKGVPTKGSVTSTLVDAFYKKIYPVDLRNEKKKQVDLLKAEYGDTIHAMLEDIYDTFIDSKTGLRKTEKSASNSKFFETDIYKKLENYYLDLINDYTRNDPKTRFFKEVKIIDSQTNIAGSIDLLIINSNNKVDIYDWKSQGIPDNVSELNTNKQEGYRIQLNAYKSILEKEYGFTSFGKIRAIPIQTKYKYSKNDEGDYDIYDLKDINIGSYNTIETEQDYLLPITLNEEREDPEDKLNIVLEKLQSRLNKIYENISSAKGTDKSILKELSSKYRKAIAHLHLRNDARAYISLAKYELNYYQKRLTNNSITPADINRALSSLQVFLNNAPLFEKYMKDLKKLQKEVEDNQSKKIISDIIDDFNSINTNAEIILTRINDKAKQIVSEKAENFLGIKDYMNAEKNIDTLNALFTSLSNIPLKSFKVLWNSLKRVFIERDNKIEIRLEKLKTLKDSYEKWAKSKGYNVNNMFDIMLEFDSKGNWEGVFLRKYDKNFSKLRDEAIKNRDFKWLNENLNFDEKSYEKSLKGYIKAISDQTFDDSDPDNDAAIKENIINKWIATHDVRVKIENYPINIYALLNKKNTFLTPTDKYLTAKWKELFKKDSKGSYVNQPAVDVYNEFYKLLNESRTVGLLDENISRLFLPAVHKSKIENLVFGDITKNYKNNTWLSNLELTAGDKFAPNIDPLTGRAINQIPRHYINDIYTENEDGTRDYSSKSKDLFKVFGIWSLQLSNYEALSKIEQEANLLVHVERLKDHILVDSTGSVVREDGKPKVDKGNEKNSALLQEMVDFYFYNKDTSSVEDRKYKIGDKEYSMKKTVNWLIRFFSLKTLALSPLSGAAQFVGGTGNALFLASKKQLFDTKDWTESIYEFSKRSPLAIALIDKVGSLEDDAYDETRKLSVSKLVAKTSSNLFYSLMRGSDKAVQYPVALSVLKNHMVVDGKIVNITKHIKEKNNYSTFYSLPVKERNELSKKINNEIEDNKRKNSLYATAKIEKDQLIIPGIDFKSEEWGMFKYKVKQVHKTILGAVSRDDINNIRTGMFGRALMQFRSWMPAMVRERFAGLNYSEDLELYTYGKTTLLLTELGSKRALTIAKSLMNLSGNSMVEAAKARYEIEKSKAFEKGEQFNISESEFIDLYIGNIRSQIRELIMILGMITLYLWAKPGDDDEEDYKGVRKYLARAFDKFLTEFTAFYNPKANIELINKPFPVVSLASDLVSFISNTFKETYGQISGDEEIQDEARPLKYLGKTIPVIKEAIDIRAVFDDDFRKEWDIRIKY